MSVPTCIGFGEFEGRCENPADANDAHLWCERCEKLRVAHLTGQFAAITALFESDE